METERLRLVDLFAGVGGLSAGFIEQGFDLVFANDYDPWAAQTFLKNHPGVFFSPEAIEDLDYAKIKGQIGDSVDVVVGGVPCQPFSMAGYRNRKSRAGVVDERVYLFRYFLKFVETFQPKTVVIENVKGLPSMLGGKVLQEICTEFSRLGYFVDWKVLDAVDFGAPQFRERFVLVATLTTESIVWPSPYVEIADYSTVGDALKNVPELNHEPRELSGLTLERVKLVPIGGNWKDLPAHLQTKSRHSGAFGRLDPMKPARTLLTRFDSPPVGYVTHPFENRTLTVREGARLQGFPDDFEFVGPRMAQFRQVGNAVSPYMSRAIAKMVVKTFGKVD